MPRPADPPSPAPLTEELYRLIGRSRRVLWLASARCLEARGESVFSWQVLCYLVHNGPAVQQDLAMAIAQDPAGMSRMLDELEARKLVRRKSDPQDRRRSVVAPTARGVAWYREASPAVIAAVDEAMRGLTLAQRKTLKGLLEVIAGKNPISVMTERGRRAKSLGESADAE
jgi:DNA-binding MarR family transcriptional regulator